MKHALQFGLAAGFLLFASFSCSPAQAQRIGASVARPMGAQPRASYSLRRSRPPLGSASHGINYAAPFSANGFSGSSFSGSGATLQQLLDPVPPPGFDYQYLSAIDSDLAEKAFIDPVTQLRLAAARRFLAGGDLAAGDTTSSMAADITTRMIPISPSPSSSSRLSSNPSNNPRSSFCSRRPRPNKPPNPRQRRLKRSLCPTSDSLSWCYAMAPASKQWPSRARTAATSSTSPPTAAAARSPRLTSIPKRPFASTRSAALRSSSRSDFSSRSR